MAQGSGQGARSTAGRIATLLGAALAAALLALAFTSTAFAADPTLHISTTEASPGDKVDFLISGTEAGDTYVIKINNRDDPVKEGSDVNGGGIRDDFKMPDLGDTTRRVSIDAEVTHGSTVTPTSDFIKYLAPGSGATGTTSPATEPVPATSDPFPAPTPIPSATPVIPAARHHTSTTHRTTTKHKSTKHKSTNTGNPGSTAPTTSTPASTPAPVSSTPSTPAPVSHATPPATTAPAIHSSSSAPAGPSGDPPAGLGASSATSLDPASVSGTARVGLAQGFPVGWLVLLGLFLLAGLAAAAVRFGPAGLEWASRPRTPKEIDAARLSALSRAARGSAELQQRLAARRAGR